MYIAKVEFHSGIFKTEKKLVSSTFEDSSQCIKKDLTNLSSSRLLNQKKLFGAKSKSQGKIINNIINRCNWKQQY